MLNRLEALPVASGTSFAAETGPEGQKSLFLDWKHLLVKIWSILENGNSEKFHSSHRGYFSWTLRTGPGGIGQLAAAGGRNPAWTVRESLTYGIMSLPDIVFW